MSAVLTFENPILILFLRLYFKSSLTSPTLPHLHHTRHSTLRPSHTCTMASQWRPPSRLTRTHTLPAIYERLASFDWELVDM
jgi:hypothetical protein